MGEIVKASVKDAPAILSLQKVAYLSEAALYGDFTIQPLTQKIEEVEKDFEQYLILNYIDSGEIIGSVRAKVEAGNCFVTKLMVHPDAQNKGIGKKLMEAIENEFSGLRFELFTGSKSAKNIAFYEKLGYKGYKKEKLPREETVFLFMEKNE